MWNIFEQPWLLLIVAVVALAAVLVARAFLPRKRRLWLWLIPLVLVLAAFACDLLVSTDLEQIKHVISAAVQAVEQENPDAIDRLISESYSDSVHPTKRDLMFYCRRKFSEPLIEKNILGIPEIKIQQSHAAAIFTVRVLFDQNSYIYQNFGRIILVKVKVELQKEPDNGWRITKVEPLEVDMQPANWQTIRHTEW
jgi:hypothetical protein